MIRVRALGSSVCHLADDRGLNQYDATHWGAPCVAVVAPVATLCRVTLRRDVVRVPDRTERGYQVTCKTCRMLAEVAPGTEEA